MADYDMQKLDSDIKHVTRFRDVATGGVVLADIAVPIFAVAGMYKGIIGDGHRALELFAGSVCAYVLAKLFRYFQTGAEKGLADLKAKKNSLEERL